MRKVAIYAQSVFRKDLAGIELRRLKKAAKDTNALENAKIKLEKEAKELAMRLQEEERIRAEMEEAKQKEAARLQSAVKEMEAQLADMEEAKNKEQEKLQSTIKEMEVQLANMEDAKNKEHEKLQSAIKEMEAELVNMEEAKSKEHEKLQSALKEKEAELANMEEAKSKEHEKLQSAIKEKEAELANMDEVKTKENEKLQSAIKEMEAELANLEEAKSKEHEKLQSAIKEMEAELANMEEAKTKENEKLQSALKEKEAEMANMEEARTKETAELQSAVKEMEVQLAEVEETKNKENAKLQSAIEEMKVQFLETKELSEVAQKEMEQVRVADSEKIETLTTDNEKLKDVVSSLEQEINETQTKYEESSKLSEDRLNQAIEAESKIIDLKMDMQSLQEKIADMEAEDQILRQQEGQSGSPSKKFDSNLTQSTIGRERELVDSLMKSASEDLGFSQGKPVTTYVIYKSLLHCKAFEADITTIFDRIIQVIGSAIEKQEDIKHMAYWLSVTSNLLFLVQKTLSPSPPEPQQPTSLFGRMTQGFRSASIISIVCHVEVKYPALLFKKQLAAYVEKIYAFIRNNLKKDLSQLLSSCIQAPIISDGKSFPTDYWDNITERLNELLDTLKEYHVPTVIIKKIFSQVFSFIDVQLFNSLLLHKECCTFANGEYVRAGLGKLELWCTKAATEYADSSSDELDRVRQAVGFLVRQQKSKISYDEFTTKLCPALNIQQVYKLSTFFSHDNGDTHSVSPEVVSKFKGLMSEDSNESDGDSYLLDDNSSMAFPVDEISKSINEKDFSNIKPSAELLEKPEFKFLLE